MKRDDPFISATFPGDAFAEMKENAIDVFYRNLHPAHGMDHALGATYLDGFVAGALFALKHGVEGLQTLTGER